MQHLDQFSYSHLTQKYNTLLTRLFSAPAELIFIIIYVIFSKTPVSFAAKIAIVYCTIS